MMKNYVVWKLVLSCFCLATFSVIGHAQTERLLQFSSSNGLPSNTIYDIDIDTKGYIWIGTGNGLCRFDGEKVKTYTSPFLKEHEIIRVKCIPNGDILFLNVTRQLSIIRDEKLYTPSIPGCDGLGVKDFLVDPKENLWIGLPRKNKDDAEKLDSGLGDPHVLLSDLYPSYATVNRLGFGGFAQNMESNKLLAFVDLRYKIFDAVSHFGKPVYAIFDQAEDLVPSQEVNTPKLSGYKWLSRIIPFKEDFLILFIDGQKVGYISEDGEVEVFELLDKSRFTQIFDILPSKNGEIYFATNKGVFVGGFEDKEIKIKNDFILRNKSCTKINQDKNGNFIIGTEKNGLFILPYHSYRTWELKDEQADIQYIRNLSVFDDRSIMGISDQGNWYKVSSDQVQLLAKMPKHNYKGVVKGGNENYYFYGNDIFYEIDSQGVRNNFIFNAQIGFMKNVKCIRQTSLGTILGYYYNVLHINEESKLIDSLANGRTVSLLEDIIGKKILLGTSLGLKVYDHKNGVKTFIDKNNKSVPYMVYSMVQTDRGDIFLGTHGQGLWQVRDNVLSRVDEIWGIEAKIYPLLTVSNNLIWASTEKGLKKIDTQNGLVESIKLTSNQLQNEILGLIAHDSMVWVSTTEGISFFPVTYPISDLENTSIHLDGITAYNRAGDKSEGKVLPPGFDQIEIKFSAISIGKSISFQFRREGSTSWNDLPTPFLQLDNIAPGKHAYEIRIKSGDPRSKPGEILKVKFTLKSYLWQEAWFWIMLMIGFFGLLIIEIRRRIQLKEQRANQKLRMEREIESYRVKALRAQMNPHFTFNVLNAIQQYLLLGNNEEAHLYLVEFSRLIRTALNSTSRDWMELKKEITFLRTYVKLELLRFSDKASVIWDVSKELENSEILIPHMIIQPLVENAFIHGLSQKRKDGLLFIKIFRHSSLLFVIIKDNGIGFKKSGEMQDANYHSHNSQGISMVQERLGLLYSDKEDMVQYDFFDLADNDYVQNFDPIFETGSVVILQFPIE
ncbi:MAG: histidine kinase [Bacteroidia bacterium]|nr:histidine kinase [Bacteroidia bacterium]